MKRDRLTLVAFILGSALAGGNGVAVRFSNRELEPLWGAAFRFALAGLLLLAIMAVLRLPFPRGRALAGVVLYGALSFAGAYAFAYYALLHIHAGLGQTILALVPLATLLVAVLFREERFRARVLVGSLIALAGVAVISGASLGEELPLLSLLAALGGVLCFALAAVLIHRFPAVHPVTVNAVGMTTGALLLFLGAVIAGESLALPRETDTWLALAYLVPIGSIAIFLLYLFVIREWGASRAAYSFVLIPFVTVILSAWLDEEPLGWNLLIGGPLIIAGVYVGALRHPNGEAKDVPVADAER